ncbi:hypothetical protein L1049_008986 [Liquidambar formosana]|uniref:TF-B3 domain-containing protein n=1 Tax=Liquidambar formosana TaxID=63359 RepID=A0AAP0S4B9_LIQFO
MEITYHDFMKTEGGDKRVVVRNRPSTSTAVIDGTNAIEWPIQKCLSISDVSVSVLCLPLQQSQEHILPHLTVDQRRALSNGKHIDIDVLDVDEGYVTWEMNLKLSNSSQYHLLGSWKANFVNRKRLKAGQKIGMRWRDGKLQFSRIG